MSMPPAVHWHYGWTPDPDSPEEVLYQDYLRPRDWLAEAEKAEATEKTEEGEA